MEIHVQLTKTGAVTVNHLKLIRSVKPNSCRFSQLCYTFTGHQLNTVYYVSLLTSRFCCLGVTMATIYVYAIGSIYFWSACWHPLAYDVIIMQFTVMMIRRLFLIFHLHNIPYCRVRTRITTVIEIPRYEVFCHKHETCMSSYPFRKKDKGTKNVVEKKDVLDTQQLEESFKISKNYKKYGTSDRVKKVRKTVIISKVKIMKHLIQLSVLQEIRRKATEIQSNSRQKNV